MIDVVAVEENILTALALEPFIHQNVWRLPKDSKKRSRRLAAKHSVICNAA
jgi:hypothetical protein